LEGLFMCVPTLSDRARIGFYEVGEFAQTERGKHATLNPNSAGTLASSSQTYFAPIHEQPMRYFGAKDFKVGQLTASKANVAGHVT
jgi:hypothetical protein